jgi:CelD/BcsL family acetyltransferase involved in cellulose biosynthesis
MSIICIDPLTDTRWQELAECHPSSVFNSPEWMRVVAETYDFEINAYVLLDASGAPQAGIPFCRISDIRGSRIVSIPFSDYSDPLVTTAEQWHMLADKLLAEEQPVIFRCLHNTLPVDDHRLTEFKRAKWHGVDLERDQETIWMSLDGAARRAIKKAQKSGVIIRKSKDKEAVRTFFEMHLGIRKYKYRLVAQPYSFFENIWKYLIDQGDGVVFLAEHEGQVIGGIMFLAWKDTFFYKFNASSLDDLAVRPNDLMVWEGIQYAKEHGYHKFDFGLSDWDQEGLLRYKRKFATEEKTIFFLEHEPDHGTPPYVRQARQLLPSLTDLFTDDSVPDAITEKAGDVLYRFFS